MDNWTEANLLAMLLGGNRQLRSFFRRQKIENSEVEVLYRTKQATYYREQLGAQVERMLDKNGAARPEARLLKPLGLPKVSVAPRLKTLGFPKVFRAPRLNNLCFPEDLLETLG